MTSKIKIFFLKYFISSSRAYSDPLKTIATSNKLFRLSLSNAISISITGLISFRVFLTVSFYLCRGLPLDLFPIKLFSMTFLMNNYYFNYSI